MKYLIIGLGNPGAEYENTRHNIGFKVLDKLASLSNTSFFTDKYADVADIKFKGRNLVLIKPNTFMNLSGKAVGFTKISLRPLNIISQTSACLSLEKEMLDKLASLSNTLNPILCLVFLYSAPGLPNPMIRYFIIIQEQERLHLLF